MTAQEAINRINFCKPPEAMWGKAHEAFEVAIEALEKQIPKKPTKDQVVTSQDIFTGNVTTDDVFNCPNCESFIGYVTDCSGEYSEPYQIPYCQGCGQKLDWGE